MALSLAGVASNPDSLSFLFLFPMTESLGSRILQVELGNKAIHVVGVPSFRFVLLLTAGPLRCGGEKKTFDDHVLVIGDAAG